MTDPTHSQGADAGTEIGRGSPPRIPRWLKLSAMIILALVLLFVILKLTGVGGGMDHGPGAPAGGH
jgi:hypothetical protein